MQDERLSSYEGFFFNDVLVQVLTFDALFLSERSSAPSHS